MVQEIDKFFPARSDNDFLKNIYLTNEYKNKTKQRRFLTFLFFSTASFSLGFVSGYLAATKSNPK